MTGRPCGCWHAVALHEGHCCFRDAYDRERNLVTCGHDAAGMAIAETSDA